MVVPSRRQAARLLLDLEPPDWLLRHSAAVAEIASFLADRIGRAGGRLDPELAEAAALLHDVDKALPAGDPLAQLGHGHAGAALLSLRGYGELGPAVANHPVTRLADDRHWAAWSKVATLEEKVVAYADKRATLRLVPMAARFAQWRLRYPDDVEGNDKAEMRARELELDVCRVAGVAPQGIGRRRWVRSALTSAADGRASHPVRS
jgi:putative nucleotidyltransferase with HDIG domain